MKAERKERSESRAGVGVSSVLMILVVLAMAALGMLAFSRARSTESMTRRNAEATQAYYAAAATVQRRLQEIDQAALEKPVPCEDALGWYEARGIENVEWSDTDGEIRFTISVEDGQERRVIAKGKMLEGEKRRFELSSHCLVSSQPDEPIYLDLIGD